jgi:hypothetical protein
LDGVFFTYDFNGCPNIVSGVLAAPEVANSHVANYPLVAVDTDDTRVTLVNAPKELFLQARYGNDVGGYLTGNKEKKREKMKKKTNCIVFFFHRLCLFFLSKVTDK